MEPITILTVLQNLLDYGVTGLIAVLFIIFYRRERAKVDEAQSSKEIMAKSFNRQIRELNDRRAQEIEMVSKALQSNASSQEHLAHSLERLRDFMIDKKIMGEDDEEN